MNKKEISAYATIQKNNRKSKSSSAPISEDVRVCIWGGN